MGAERHVRACPEQGPACPQQAELAEEHTYLGLSAPEPSFKQQGSGVPPLSEVQGGNDVNDTEFGRKMV